MALGQALSRVCRVETRARSQSILAPDNLTIAAHVGNSLATHAANSCGEPVCAMALKRAKPAFASAEARLSFIERLGLGTDSGGVPAGATTPVQASTVKSAKPLSTRVGTSGSSGQRSARATASGRTLPSWISG